MKSVLIKPCLTEKTAKLQAKFTPIHYCFWVNVGANKIEIKNAVEQEFNVQVSSVRTVVIAPVKRRRITKSVVVSGKTVKTKKAYVTLTGNQVIEALDVNNNENNNNQA